MTKSGLFNYLFDTLWTLTFCRNSEPLTDFLSTELGSMKNGMRGRNRGEEGRGGERRGEERS
jgi:hypothetical protein